MQSTKAPRQRQASPVSKLDNEDYEQFRSSGLSDETIAALGCWTVTNRHEARVIAGHAKRSPLASKLVPAIVIPHFDIDREIAFKYLRPRQEVLFPDGEKAKYINPRGLRNPPPYFVPTIPRADFLNPKRALFITEGVKKAALIAQVTGCPVLSAQGTWGFHDAAVRNTPKPRAGPFVRHPGYQQIPVDGRKVLFAFDGQDTTFKVGVIGAEARNARILMELGANVGLIRVPFDRNAAEFDVANGMKLPGKTGIDDYLGPFDENEREVRMVEMIDNRIPADPVERSRRALLRGAQEVEAMLFDIAFWQAVMVAPLGIEDEVRETLNMPSRSWRTRFEQMKALMKEPMKTEGMVNRLRELSGRPKPTTRSTIPTGPTARSLPAFISSAAAASPPCAPASRDFASGVPAPIGVAGKSAKSLQTRSRLALNSPQLALNSVRRGRPPKKRDRCAKWLRFVLRNGRVSVRAIRDYAKEDEVAWKTVRNAKAVTCIGAKRVGAETFWELL